MRSASATRSALTILEVTRTEPSILEFCWWLCRGDPRVGSDSQVSDDSVSSPSDVSLAGSALLEREEYENKSRQNCEHNPGPDDVGMAIGSWKLSTTNCFSTNTPAFRSVPHGIILLPSFLSKISAFSKREECDGLG